MERILNEMQKEAVEHNYGPALVLAGPGSGKTTVIASRTVRLEKEIVCPSEILTLCFGREAAAEMRRRYELFREKDSEEKAKFSTVHSICFTIVKDFNKGNIRVLEGQKKNSVLREIYEKTNGRKEIDIEQLSSAISRHRNASEKSRKIPPQIYRFGDICELYDEYKKINRLIDYDDMVFKAYDILKNYERIRRKYAKEFIQADEGQDLSETQFKIICLLAENGNIFTVADDDQSIYGFRGAAPECIVNYREFFPNAAVYKLEKNYRSTKKIVEFASSVAKINTVRCEKNIYTENEEGEPVEIICFPTGIRQDNFIVKTIEKGLKSNRGETFGILYRNNISALSLMLLLNERKIPFEISGGFTPPGKMFMVEKFLNDAQKEEKDKIIIPSPKRILRKSEKNGLIEESIINCEITGKQKRTVRTLTDFLELLCEFSQSYDECAEKSDLRGRMNIYDEKDECRIFLSTVHSAKGLEYDNVFVTDVVKDEFPGKGSYTGTALEEERRLFYVAVTRAKKRLYITYHEKRGGMAEEKSIFIAERENKW